MVYKIPYECFFFRSSAELSPSLRASLLAMAVAYGDSEESHSIIGTDRHYLWLNDHSGVVGFRIWGSYISVMGGLIAPPENKWRVLNVILEFARLNRMTLSMYHIPYGDLGLFKDFEFQITKIGEHSVVNLERFTPDAHAIVPSGLASVIKEVVPATMERRAWDALCKQFSSLPPESWHMVPLSVRATRILRAPLAGGQLCHRRVFVAFDQAGDVIGFVILSPHKKRQSWAVEASGFRKGMSQQIANDLIGYALLTLKRDGATNLSLPFQPGAGCEQRMPKESRLYRWLLMRIYKRLHGVGEVSDRLSIKDHDAFCFEPVYACVYPRMTLGSTWAQWVLTDMVCFGTIKKFGAILLAGGEQGRQDLPVPLDDHA